MNRGTAVWKGILLISQLRQCLIDMKMVMVNGVYNLFFDDKNSGEADIQFLEIKKISAWVYNFLKQ
jgi:hypothetical protein